MFPDPLGKRVRIPSKCANCHISGATGCVRQRFRGPGHVYLGDRRPADRGVNERRIERAHLTARDGAEGLGEIRTEDREGAPDRYKELWDSAMLRLWELDTDTFRRVSGAVNEYFARRRGLTSVRSPHEWTARVFDGPPESPVPPSSPDYGPQREGDDNFSPLSPPPEAQEE